MKPFQTTGYAISGSIVRPVIYCALDQLAQRIFLIGDLLSTEIQFQYAEGLFDMMHQFEIHELLSGVVIPSRVEAFLRLARNVKTFAGQRREWQVLSALRELRNRVVRDFRGHEEMYYFNDLRQRDLFWQTFADQRLYKRLMGLTVVQRHVLFTAEERMCYLSNLNGRIATLYSNR